MCVYWNDQGAALKAEPVTREGEQRLGFGWGANKTNKQTRACLVRLWPNIIYPKGNKRARRTTVRDDHLVDFIAVTAVKIAQQTPIYHLRK